MSESSWTPALQERFQADWDAKVSIRDIARRLDMTIGKVNRMARKLGLSRTPAIRLGRPRTLSANEHINRLHRVISGGQAPVPMPAGSIPPTIWKRLLELEPGECRWPLGERRAVDFVFCAMPTEGSSPYCACHARVAYTTALRSAA